MKILTLSNCPLESSQGSGYVVLSYASGLRELGHEVDCFGPESYEPWPWMRRARRWRLTLGMALLTIRRRLFRGVDIVEFYGAESWLAVLLLRAVRTRCVLIHHSNGIETLLQQEMIRNSGTDTHSGRPRRWYQPRAESLLALSFSRVDLLVVVSRSQYRFASERQYQPRNRLLCIENPLTDDFLGQRIDLDRGASLGYCGPWLHRKGVSLLAATASRLLAERPELNLHLVGVGKGFDKYAVFPAAVCDRVRVTPFVDSKSYLRDWYRSISIVVMPSFSESFGLVTAEAMACGCAVVATPTGFAADLVHGEEAMVLPGFTADDVSRAVSSLLDDDSLRRRVARSGHARVQGLRWQEASSKLEAFYAGRLAAHRATPAEHQGKPIGPHHG